jgi:hypothetical protein
VYLKFLYFPKLTTNDMHILLDKFEDEYKSLNNKNRFNYLLSLSSGLGTWALAYSYRLKFTTFLVATACTYFGAKWALDCRASFIMQRNLNNFAYSFSEKYPEVKYSKVVYTKSKEIKAPKLI